MQLKSLYLVGFFIISSFMPCWGSNNPPGGKDDDESSKTTISYSAVEVKITQENNGKRSGYARPISIIEFCSPNAKRPKNNDSVSEQAGTGSSIDTISSTSKGYADENSTNSTLALSSNEHGTPMDVDESIPISPVVVPNAARMVLGGESEGENEELKKAEEGLKNTLLSIYLMKKVEKPRTDVKVSEEKRKEFDNFPWEYINENKHTFIGLSHSNESFIDGQYYAQIIDGEEIYIFQETRTHQTDWVETISEQAKEHKIKEKTRNSLFEHNRSKEPKGAIVFIKKIHQGQERFFALTFGWTGRFLLNLDWCDSSFGKHYAYNLLSLNPTYKAQSFKELSLDKKTLKSEQAKTNGKVELIRRVRAVIPKSLTVTNGKEKISSFIGAHICIRGKFSFQTIGRRCWQYLRIANDESYKKSYSYIDHFTPLENQDEIDTILRKSFGDCHFEPPLEIEGSQGLHALHKYELSSSLSLIKHFSIFKPSYDEFSFLSDDLKKFVMACQTGDVLDKLTKLKITAKDDNNNLLALWTAHQLLTAKVDFNGKTYWIEDGEVFEVHLNFISLINQKLDDSFLKRSNTQNESIMDTPADFILKRLTPFMSQDTEKRRGRPVLSEGAYNKRIVDENPDDFMLFDRGTIRVQGDPNLHSKVEPCDLLSKEGDLIHLKRWTNSSSCISYLVTQALSSSSLLLEEQTFLDSVCKDISMNDNFKGVPQKLREKKFRVVLAFIHSDENIQPSGLAFNAKLALFRGLVELEKMGLTGIIMSIKDDSSQQESYPTQSSHMDRWLQKTTASS